jgi:hypothetical protein
MVAGQDGLNDDTSVAMIADALRLKYGSEAISVAEQQRAASSGDIRETWTHVVAALAR